jgi:hypothetical protein
MMTRFWHWLTAVPQSEVDRWLIRFRVEQVIYQEQLRRLSYGPRLTAEAIQKLRGMGL